MINPKQMQITVFKTLYIIIRIKQNIYKTFNNHSILFLYCHDLFRADHSKEMIMF